MIEQFHDKLDERFQGAKVSKTHPSLLVLTPIPTLMQTKVKTKMTF
jgi:hypothetical protein